MEKIPKLKKLQNVYTKTFGVMLILSVFFVGCRQREVLPEPQADLIGKMKAWFKTKTKNNTTTSTDTTTWYPQWQDGIIQAIDAHTRLALFPVHRKRAVQYYEIGFVRRLAIRIDAQGEVIDGQIIEMLSSKTYLREHKNVIPLRYYQGYVPDSDYALVFRSLYDERVKRDKDILEEFCVASVTLNFLECTLNVTYSEACDMASYTMPITGGCGGGSSGTGGGIGSSPPSGGWGTPIYPSGGGSPYIPVYTDYPVGGGGSSTPPCPTCLSEDLGDNTNPTTDKVTLDKTFKEDARAMCIYEKLKGNQVAMFNQITNAFKEANVELVFKADTIKRNGLPSNLRMGETVDSLPRKVIITLNKDPLNYDAPVKFAAVLLHEMLHAYWRLKLHQIGGYQNLNALPATGNNGMNTSNPDYADLKKAYNDYPYDPQEGHNVPHHNLMATPKYRQKLAQGIFEWAQNTGAGITQEECYALTQEGLFHDYVPAIMNRTNSVRLESRKLIDDIYRKSRSSHCL